MIRIALLYCLLCSFAVGCSPTADFEGEPTKGCEPLTVNFKDKSAGSVSKWMWDFGDNTTSDKQNPSHTYTKSGTYTISLKINGSSGDDEITRKQYIKVSNQAMCNITANFSASPRNGDCPVKVIFKYLSKGGVTTWEWDFGDNATSTEQNPTHTYDEPGKFTVTLKVENEYAEKKKTAPAFINVKESDACSDAKNAVAEKPAPKDSPAQPEKISRTGSNQISGLVNLLLSNNATQEDHARQGPTDR